MSAQPSAAASPAPSAGSANIFGQETFEKKATPSAGWTFIGKDGTETELNKGSEDKDPSQRSRSPRATSKATLIDGKDAKKGDDKKDKTGTGSEASTAASAAPAGAQHGGKSGRRRGDDQVIEGIAKLSLNTAQRLREVENAVIESWVFPSDHQIIKALADTGKRYHDLCAGKTDHKYGPPHVHKWGTLMRCLQEAKPPSDSRHDIIVAFEVVYAHYQQLEKFDLEDMAELCRHCRTKTCREQKDKVARTRLFYAVNTSCSIGPRMAHRPIDLDMAVKLMLQQAGGTKSLGPAPPSMLEKQVGNWLATSKSD